MPDSVSCKMDSSHAFTCEVDIGPDPAPNETTPPTQSTPAAPPPVTTPVVSSLIAGYSIVGRDVIAPAHVPLSELAARIAPTCLSGEAGVALLIGGKVGVLGALAGIKAGFDLGKCVALEKNALVQEATSKAAEADCAASGGVVTGVIGNQVMCNVTGSVQ